MGDTAELPQPVKSGLATPLGDLLLVTDQRGVLYAAEWADCAERLLPDLRSLPDGSADPGVAAALGAYFAGQVRRIDAIRVATTGTPFQRAVWGALRSIPAGGTMTYGALARSLGRPRASRAVGHANGANPFSVVVPCHRLVGAGGLTGYGGGLHRKKWLLAHEARFAHVSDHSHEP